MRPRPPSMAPGFSKDASAWELVRRLCVYLGRSARLRCPECGVSHVFMPASKTRTVHDWVTPLDGCPRCGYAYQREGGYFLIATWGIHYFTVTGVCLVAALLADHFLDVSFTTLAVSVSLATLAFGFWFSRYAKSLYLAIDHFFDPHVPAPAGPGDPPATPSGPTAPLPGPEYQTEGESDAVSASQRQG